MKTWIVYKHTNKINGKIYVGQTCQKLEERWGKQGNKYAKSSPVFWKAIQKYGWDNFEHEIIESNILTQEEAWEKEKYWIKHYDCCILDGKNKGYNSNRGGQGFSSEQSLKYIKENWENGTFTKIFCSPVICVNTQKIYSSIKEAAEDTGAHKDGISAACRGVKNSAGVDSNGLPLQWAYYEEGKTYTYLNPKYKNKRMTKVKCLNTGEIFNCIKEACEKYNIHPSCISGCIYGRQKTAGKLPDGTRLVWELYKNEE